MKNFIEILTENGIEIPEEKKESINKAVAENYKTIAEHIKVANKLNDANETIKGLNEQIKTIETDGEEFKALKQKVNEYETAEKTRKEQEEADKVITALKGRFSGLCGDKEYLNEGTEKWIFDEFKKAIEDQNNVGKSDAEIYSDVTKDKDIFKAENKKYTNPSANGGTGDEAPVFKRFI